MLVNVIVLISFFLGSNGQGFYKVVGPRIIHPNSEYHCAISIEATSEPTTVITSLEGTSYNGTAFSEFGQVVVQPYTSKMSRLRIGDIGPGSYRLIVKGRGGLDFVKELPLTLVEKSYTVLVQTDRSVYRPGTKIQFRAIVLNPHLKPAIEFREEPINVFITDGGGNRVKEWKNVRIFQGIFTGELKLSENPILGNWNISVQIRRQIYNKSIRVANYILPKFIINIDIPKYVTFKDKFITAKIESRYNYGKEVKGEATITVYPTIYSGVIQPIFQNPIRKVMRIDGSTSVEFDIERDLMLNDEYERMIIVDVTIEEEFTGRRQNNSARVFIHKYDQKMELIKTADYFKPGLKYIAYVKITNHDGTPIHVNREEVIVRHGYSRVDEVYVEEKYKTDKNGIIKLEYYPPINATNTTALRIEAEYRGLKERISPIPASVSYSHTYLQVSLETDRPIVNLDVEIMVNCTESLRYIDYVLISKGNVLMANTFHVNDRNYYKFRFIATHAMVPVVHLIVSYTRKDGELISDALDIEIDGVLQNFVDIQTNTLESEPGLDVDFMIRSQPNSYIGLMVVDDNLKKIGTDYDLSLQEVVNDLMLYDSGELSPYSAIKRSNKFHFPWKPGSSNSYTAFYDSGADLLTNSIVNHHKPTLEDIYLRPVFYGSSTVKPDRGFGLPIHGVTRPPLAGPYAFSRIPKPVWNKPKIYLSEDVANTWLFMNFTVGNDGKTSLRKKIPENLNTWTVTGFSVNAIHGLGVITEPKQIRVNKPLVVSLDLPYSIQRGEVLSVPVVVDNNINQDVNVDITLHNPEQKFEFVDSHDNVNSTKRIELYRRKKIAVKANRSGSVTFLITPLREGSIELKATANSPRNQDVTTKNLLVKIEGETEYFTKTVLVNLRDVQEFKETVNLTFPKNFIRDSEKITVSTVGDLLGPTMVNLDNLIRLPTDCGEQNLVYFIPDIIIMEYLRNTQVRPILDKATELLESGYQQQLNYKRKDGSFSAFGDRDDVGSVWLTSYVALSFIQAKKYIYIDDQVIENCLKWLDSHQNRNGSFYETGPILHAEMQNPDGNSIALTAFTLMAFIEAKNRFPEYENTINKGLDYIARNLDEDESTYALALCSYTLQLARHPSKQSAFNLLETRSKFQNNMKWWMKDISKSEEKSPWNKLPKSLDIEITSYALLTLLEANLIGDAVPVINWLVRQQNEMGGFTSSHDTVIGLYAIYQLVTKLANPSNMKIDFSYRRGQINTFTINENNRMIEQKFQIPKTIDHINVTARGSGFALFRVAYQYNLDVTGPWPMFTLDPQVDKNSNQNHLQVSICTAFVSRNLSDRTTSNMAVMEVHLPSGFTADVDSLPSLEVSQNVKKVEVANDLTKIVLYFNNITSKAEYCPTVSAFRTHKVAKQKPVAVVVYDYYDSSRRSRIFYRGRNSRICQICEGDDCKNCRPEDIPADEPRPGQQIGGCGQIFVNWPFLLVMFILTHT